MKQKFQLTIFTLANGNFIAWPSNVPLTFYLPEQIFYMNSQIILKSKSMHRWRSYAPDKHILWLFFHLNFKWDLDLQSTEQMFQMTLPLVKKNKYAKIFRNSCIIQQVMAHTSSIYDNFII